MSGVVDLILRPMQQLSLVQEKVAATMKRWRTIGNDPAYTCAWDGGRMPGGWYLLDFDLEVHKGRVCNPCFYPDYYGVGIREDRKIDLQIDAPTGTKLRSRDMVVLFVADVGALRFDPTVVPAEFSISELRLRRIGKLQAARRLLAGVLKYSVGADEKIRVIARMLAQLVTSGPRRMAERLYLSYQRRIPMGDPSDYDVWVTHYDVLNDMRREDALKALADLASRPIVSIVLPTYNTPERWLRRCIESVQEQIYPDWQLCIADDASTLPHVKNILNEYAASDSRIKVTVRDRNGHISAASNSALALADGEYVALLDHDDELHPLALLECVKAFEANPEWQMLFTDEDKMDEQGRRSDPYFKSDWNPDLFFSQNCICHLSVYKRPAVEQAGGFQVGVEGAQDWDLTLRVVERLSSHQIGHVPKVLYHWRMIAGSTAFAPGEKSYAHLAALRVLQAYFDRNAIAAKVLEIEGFSGYYRIAYDIAEPTPLVSLLIPTRDRVDLLRQCIESIVEKTDYPNFEIIVLDNDSSEHETLKYLENVVRDSRVRVVKWDRPFNYSAINNYGASFADGEFIGLLNNDVEVISPDWLTEMVGHAQRPEIGVVGAMLYYPDDTIQHAGVVLGIGGVAGHVYVGTSRGYPGHKHRAGLAQTLSAVTAACAVMRTSVFREVGGLDETLQVAFNDIDLCLRIRERGYRNLWTPFAELYHYESATRGYEDTPEKVQRFKREQGLMKERWQHMLTNDPYYNPNFSLTDAPFTLAYPPRVYT